MKGGGGKFLNLKMTLEKILTAENDVLGIYIFNENAPYEESACGQTNNNNKSFAIW